MRKWLAVYIANDDLVQITATREVSMNDGYEFGINSVREWEDKIKEKEGYRKVVIINLIEFTNN